MGERIALQAFNGQYLCAEGGGGGRIVANRNWIREWETFELINLGGGSVALRVHNGQYVCAEGGGGRELLANRPWIQSWETFRRVEGHNRSIGLVAANGQYVCAEGGGGRDVVANRPHFGVWEEFRIVRTEMRPIAFLDGTIMCAFQNNSDSTVWVKPESGTHAIEVPPTQRYEGPIDGVAVPSKAPGKVLKVVDNCDAEATNDGVKVHCNDVNLSSFVAGWDFSVPGTGGVNAQVIQRFTGGWLTAPPDNGWNSVFNASQPAPPPDQRRHSDGRDRERREFERMDRNQYDIWERQDREWVGRTA